MKFTRIFDLVVNGAKSFGQKTAFSNQERGKWIDYSFVEYLNNANHVSAQLLDLGIEKNDVVVTISPNRAEWNFIDMGVLQIGCVHAPLFPTFSKDDFRFVIENCNAKVVIVSGDVLLKLILEIQPDLPNLEYVMTIDENDAEAMSLWDGISLSSKHANEIDVRRDAVLPEDVASISYSSGTYWKPMGAEVQHKPIVAMTKSFSQDYTLNENDRALSFLPLCHAYERAHTYAYQYCGVSAYYTEIGANLLSIIQEVQPTIFTSVPALLENLFSGLTRPKEGATKKELIVRNEALEFAFCFEPKNNTPIPNEYEVLFSSWKQVLGENIRIISCAGAPLAERLSRAFWAMGINLLEAYGITEAQLVSINSLKTGYQCGTVGPPQENVQVKIAPDGEILCKSDYIMLRYHNNPESTRTAFTKDGWYKTGDIGEFVDSKFLKIVGRKKVLFKAANGRYVSPARIETVLIKSDIISQALVFEMKGVIYVAIVPSTSLRGEIKTDIRKRMELEIDKLYNETVPLEERIAEIVLIDRPWTVESGDLTPNMKPRRKVIMSKMKF